MATNQRQFEIKPAVRERVPLLIGLVGASGSGKSMSALRLATGFGGSIFVIDTEARRALWYAEQFKFQHVEFKSPFGPLDYLAAIEQCVKAGAKTIIIDSLSHEHEGPGGVLEMHEAEAERLSALWKVSRDKANMSAWQKPKSQRRQLLNTILQMPVNFICCFRAKEKINLAGSKPQAMGWMPIAGEEMIYEMTVNCLLMPNAGGVPSWHPNEMGEKAIIKLPGQFASIFAKQEPLSESIGAKLAEWATGAQPQAQRGASVNTSAEMTEREKSLIGDANAKPPVDREKSDALYKRFKALFDSAASVGELEMAGRDLQGVKSQLSEECLISLRGIYNETLAALKG